MKAAQYQRTSSLAKKFVTDFPDVPDVPLQLPSDQVSAFDAHVRPLLDLAEGGDPHVPDAALQKALRRLTGLMREDAGRYEVLRAVADYVQSTFAQCMLDAAASWALDADRAAFLVALSARCPAAADEALLQELRWRLVAAGAGDASAPLALSLRAAGRVPLEAVAEEGGAGAAAAAQAGVELPFKGLAAAARGDGFSLNGGRVSWPALRRSLAAASGRYLEPVLGEVGEGRAKIMVTGGALMSALLGAQHPPALGAAQSAGGGGEAAASSPPAAAGVAAAARWFDLSVVGPGGLEAAARGVEDYTREVLNRHKMRHADAPPPADASGRPLAPLLLLTQRALFALLPEAARGAAAASGAPSPADPHRDVGFRLRMQTYKTAEELLLNIPVPAGHPEDDPFPESAHARDAQAAKLLREPPPAPADAWGEGAAFDGDDAFVLPTGARALRTGRALVDPGRLRPAAAAVAAALRGVGGEEGGEEEEGDRGAGRERRAAVELVRALALQGWEPEVLLPPPRAAAGAAAGAPGGVLGALLRASGAEAPAGGDGGGGRELGLAAWERADVDADKAAASLVAATDGLALTAEALRAALGGGGGGAAAAGAAAHAGAAARAREVQAALRREHGWIWREVDESDTGSELPEDMAAALRQRLRLPLAPAPAEPVAAGGAPAGAAGASWFYGGFSA